MRRAGASSQRLGWRTAQVRHLVGPYVGRLVDRRRTSPLRQGCNLSRLRWAHVNEQGNNHRLRPALKSAGFLPQEHHQEGTALQNPRLPTITSIRNSMLSYHLSGTCSGIAAALAEIDNATTPSANLIFFMSPSTDEGGRISIKRFTVSGASIQSGSIGSPQALEQCTPHWVDCLFKLPRLIPNHQAPGRRWFPCRDPRRNGPGVERSHRRNAQLPGAATSS